MLNLLKWFGFGVLALMLIIALAALVFRQALPANQAVASHHTPNPNSNLFRQIQPIIAQHRHQSGVYLLSDAQEAFVARLALTRLAESSLDVQYYIWHDDLTGRLLLQQLYSAAERGVQVRLLLDDNNTKGLDALLAAADAHPNLEIRLFNPFMQRNHRLLAFASDFHRLNRRMHNKSFTADGVVSIVGGRNIGDEYFDAGSGVMFADLDMITIGESAQAVSSDFDRYWNHTLAYPLSQIIPTPPAPFDATPAQDVMTKQYLNSLNKTPLVRQLQTGALDWLWADVQLLSDPPTKAEGQQTHQTILDNIIPMIRQTDDELLVVSPYFVPTESGSAIFEQLAQDGKKVRILTNSLSATDVAPVHAGYAKYRKQLLRHGVQLFELKPNTTIHTEDHGGMIHSSGASLHAKTFVVDYRYVFIGSFNMDPRSANLNTEMGLLVDSPKLARLLKDSLSQEQNANTYAVRLNQHNHLEWHTQESGQTLVYHSEPDSSAMKRLLVFICALLPIEWLL